MVKKILFPLLAIVIASTAIQGNEKLLPRFTFDDFSLTLITQGKKCTGARASAVINTSPDFLWTILTDYDRTAEFMPNTRSNRVIRRDGNKVFILKKMFAAIFTVTYTVEVTEKCRPSIITWRQTKGPFKYNNGKWLIEKSGEGKTRLTYRVELDHPLLTNWLRKRLVRKSIPKLFAALQKRINYLQEQKISTRAHKYP